MSKRHYTLSDRLLMHFDVALTTVFGSPPSTGRVNPDEQIAESTLSAEQRRVSEGLMRVNHTGEVCAQALYQGQAITARDSKVGEKMQEAAKEENDHLIWCERRLHELNSHTSYLNPFWYTGSLAIGITAGLIGDRWSLVFLAETENQVVSYLDEHLHRLPKKDHRSRAIVEQMKIDEANHATKAIESGAVELPIPVKRLMKLQSTVMTTTCYWF